MRNPSPLVESELNLKLTQLLDDVQKIGLTVDSYLQSKGLTMERLKEQYTREITDMYKLEFILLDIADKERVEVNDADMSKLFANLKDDKEESQQGKRLFLRVCFTKTKDP